MENNLPDRRLAQAFWFTAEDLEANRAGFITWRQRDLIDGAIDRAWRWLVRQLWFSSTAKKKKRRQVQTLCGRAHLQHYVVDRNPNQRSKDFYEYFTLKLDSSEENFTLNRKQFDVLSEGVAYRVYYAPHDNQRILSIERAISGCYLKIFSSGIASPGRPSKVIVSRSVW